MAYLQAPTNQSIITQNSLNEHGFTLMLLVLGPPADIESCVSK
jgi:hypothetical protein